MRSPALPSRPVYGPYTGTFAGTLYCVRKTAGSTGTTSAKPLAGIDAAAGKANVMPLVNFHVLFGLAGSYSATDDCVRFRSSRNSGLPVVAIGPYINSLITPDPPTGALFAAPRVGVCSCQKSDRRSAPMTRPKVLSRAGAAPNETDSR